MARSIKDDSEAHAAPKKGHNGPSHDDIRMAANEMVKFQAKREALNAEISSFRKGLKANGITLGVLDAMIKMLEWSPEEVKAHYDERDWYAEALRFPVGSQLEMFGSEATPDPVKEQLRWRNIGFKDGLAGRGWPNEFPDGCPTECFASYSQGHDEGSETVRNAFLARQRGAPVGKKTAGMAPESEASQPDAPTEAETQFETAA